MIFVCAHLKVFSTFVLNIKLFVNNKLVEYVGIYFISVVHCRCSKCYSIPTRKRVRKRSPAVTLLSLPEEIVLCVLQCLSAEDLLSVRAVSQNTNL